MYFKLETRASSGSLVGSPHIENKVANIRFNLTYRLVKANSHGKVSQEVHILSIEHLGWTYPIIEIKMIVQ